MLYKNQNSEPNILFTKQVKDRELAGENLV